MPTRLDSTAAAGLAELGLAVAGLAILWRVALGPRARAARPAPRLAPWPVPPSDFLLFLIMAFAGGFGTQVAALQGLKRTHLAAEVQLVLLGASLHLGILGGIVLYRFLIERPTAPPEPAAPGGPDPENAPRPGVLATGAATFLAAVPIVSLVSIAWQNLLDLCGVPLDKQSLVDLFANSQSGGLHLLVTVWAIFVVPVSEELVFRAGIFRYLRTRAPRWVALWGPALLFGALHFNLASFAPLAALGLVFSVAYERTSRIGTTMVAHGLFNLNTILLLLAGVNF